jgi:uracil-DNA glycosylase
MNRLLIESWHGRDLITLGREAFLWFAIDQPVEVRQRLEGFWASDERFGSHIDVELQTADGERRRFDLYPLPHPSPLNRTWRERFPELLQGRLEQLDIHPGSLRLQER